MIKTNIKMRVTPEQSRRIQEICFSKNKFWNSNGDNYSHYKKPYLFINKSIRFGLSKETFYNSIYKEIDADLFIKTNGTCKETFESLCNDFINENMKPSKSSQSYNEKQTSQPKDLESALKKIENLHIALNKKVEKNKNQALEITKLLEQKKDLQEINDTQNGYIRQLEIDIKQARNEVKFMIDAHKLHTETIKETYNFKLEQKDTIISYLESKLK